MKLLSLIKNSDHIKPPVRMMYLNILYSSTFSTLFAGMYVILVSLPCLWRPLPRLFCGETGQEYLFADWGKSLRMVKSAVLHFWLVTRYLQMATVHTLLSALTFLSITAMGPITLHLFFSLEHFWSGITGCSSGVQRKEGRPNHSLSSQRLPWPW